MESLELLMGHGALNHCRNQEGLLTLEVAAEAQSVKVLHRLLSTHPPLESIDEDRIDRVLRERGDADVIQLFRGWKAAL